MATVIQMPKRESAHLHRHPISDLLLGIAVWGNALLFSAMTFYLIGLLVVLIIRHIHHS